MKEIAIHLNRLGTRIVCQLTLCSSRRHVVHLKFIQCYSRLYFNVFLKHAVDAHKAFVKI